MKKVKSNFSKNVDKIYGRVKNVLGFKSDSSLATALNISPSSLSEHKKRGTIPWEKMFWLCEERNINFHWVITGEGPKYLLPQETGEGKLIHLEHAPIMNIMNFLYETWINSTDRERVWMEVQFEKCFTNFLGWLKKMEGKKEGTNDTDVA